jgi:hypothetical protein
MYTVVDHVLLRSLPYRSADQLLDVKEAGKKGVVGFGSPFLDIQHGVSAVDRFRRSRFTPLTTTVSLSSRGIRERCMLTLRG